VKEEVKVAPGYEKVKQVLENPVWGQVVTRFPPEPSGFLHIGHIKAIMLNYHHSRMYNGKMVLRFDDTNPSKENDNFVENIKSDIKTMGIIPERVTYSSDYFPQMQEYMKYMITNNFCYADNTESEEMKLQRDEGIESVHR